MLPELLLPAGSFEAGVAAFEGGADAVYLGLAEFSARKQARNFSFEDYRRILGLARDRGCRVYVALNTIIEDAELDRATAILAFLDRHRPDAVIFQDWGLATIIREAFPSLVLHASTQTAAQGADAARIVRERGVQRLVLPRETTISELATIKREVPELEYELFVHGALCYSFSGLCLASGRLLGRSGNRGECAQVCRSYYRAESGVGIAGDTGYWFSCRDLWLEDELASLVAAGAASLKVEGRMKSPEYAHAVARLYRGALDRLGEKPGAPDRDELAARRTAARLSFARSPTKAFLRSTSGETLLDAEFPGHRGIPAGRILRVGRGRAEIELSAPLGLRDGLLALGGDAPIPFAVSGLVAADRGTPLVRARGGGRIELDAPPGLRVGMELWRVSARELDRRAVSREEYPPAVERVQATLAIRVEAGKAEGQLALTLGGRYAGCTLVDDEVVPLAEGKRAGGFVKALSLFAENDEADFRLEAAFPPGYTLFIPDATGRVRSVALEDVFIPPSLLKKAKNRLYARAGELIAEAEATNALRGKNWPFALPQDAGPRLEVLPPRAELVFPHAELPCGMPFASPRVLAEDAPLPEAAGARFLPLMPLVADIPAYADSVEARLARELAQGRRVLVGLGALHHVALARRLLARLNAGPERLAFYGDIHLYIANRAALASWAAVIPRLAFAYYYLEGSPESQSRMGDWLSHAGAPLLAPLAGMPVGALRRPLSCFEPPLFLARGCLRKHYAEGGRCPPSCDRRWSARLVDRERRYLVLVEDCVSMLFALP